MGIWRHLNYQPTAEQLAAHLHPARLKLVAGGERGGKSFSAAMELIRRCNVEDGLFWIVGPDYEQARAEFDYCAQALTTVGGIADISYPQRGQCSLTTAWNATIETKTADDVRKLASQAPDGILMAEAAQHPYDSWLKLRGRVAEKRGWLWASGTFESSLGWYAEVWQRWQVDNPEGGQSFSLPTWANLAVFPGGRADPEIKALEATYPADLFLERFGAIPCPPAGLVFREFSFAQHVSDAAVYDPSRRVELAVDPGYAGAYAVLALQDDGGFVSVIDEVYMTGAVASEVIAECKKREWWSMVRSGVIDIAGRQHQGLPSHVEIWRDEAGIYLRSNQVGIVDGIARTHTFLSDPATKTPRIQFAPHLKHTFTEFGRYKYPQVAENRPVQEEPLDRDNHALKALAYWLYAKFGPVERTPTHPTLGHDPFAVADPAQPGMSLTLNAERQTVRFIPETRKSTSAILNFGRRR